MRRKQDRMASVLRVRRVQQDIAAASRQRAELALTAEERRLAAREDDVRRPWGDRALVDLAYAAVDRATEAVAAATTVADERRVEHLAAVQRARGIERLVERRQAEAYAEELRKAAAVLDDLATIRHSRRRR